MPLIARLYDLLLGCVEPLGFARWRSRTVGAAAGRVLEIGGGTGLNLPYYRRARAIVFTEPDPAMLGRARRRARLTRCPVSFFAADAQRLPFRSAVFDTVTASLVFCSIPDPRRALAEIRRVLAPGGELRLLEHVRTPRGWVARLQDALTPLWRRLARGCHLNRDPLGEAAIAGFEPIAVDRALDGWLLYGRLRRAEGRTPAGGGGDADRRTGSA